MSFETLPATAGMQALWMLSHSATSGRQYQYPFAFHLKGPLDRKVLEESLAGLVRNHPSLALRFTSGKTGLQCIQPVLENRAELYLETISLPADSRCHEAGSIQEIAKRFMSFLFTPDSTFTLAACLVVLSPTNHVLMLLVHHISVDAWSMGILIKELSQRYKAAISLQDYPDKVDDGFCDYLRFRQHEKNREHACIETFWRKTLADAPLHHGLPLVRTHDNDRIHCVGFQQNLCTELHKQLVLSAAGMGMTLFMLMQGLFALCLAIVSNQNRVVTGTPVARRFSTDHQMPDVSNTVGFLANTVCLHTRIEDSDTLELMLEKNRNCILEAFDHQAPDFADIVKVLNPPRVTGDIPWMQILFTHRNIREHPLKLKEVQVEQLPLFSQSIRFELEVELVTHTEQPHIHWVYNASRLHETTVRSVTRCLEYLMAQWVTGSLNQVQISSLRSRMLPLQNPDVASPETSCLRLEPFWPQKHDRLHRKPV